MRPPSWQIPRFVACFQILSICSLDPRRLLCSQVKSGWLKWREWASSKFEFPVIPAKFLHVALFITELVAKICLERYMGVSSIEGVSYGVR